MRRAPLEPWRAPRLRRATPGRELTPRPFQARDLDLDAKPRSDGATRFALQKLSVDDTKARAGESLVRGAPMRAELSNRI